MIIETVIASVILAFIRGARISELGDLRFRFWYLLIAGYLVQGIPGLLEVSGDITLSFSIASYLLIVIALFFNLRIKGVYYALMGTIFNAAVIISNNGMMPVSINSINATGYDMSVSIGQKLDVLHFASDNNVKLALLSDYIPVAKPYLFPQVLSPGDVLLCIGLFMFIQHILVKKDQDPQEAS
jgi:hypothetical protein